MINEWKIQYGVKTMIQHTTDIYPVMADAASCIVYVIKMGKSVE